MKSSNLKTALAGMATALVLTALPFTMSATNRNGDVSVEFGANVACAEGQACCVEFGSMCSGRMHYKNCSPE